MLAKLQRAIDALRKFPPTAPIVAAVDTLVATVRGNLTYALSEPWVVASTVALTVSVVDGAPWYVVAGSYALGVARWLTTPRIDTRKVA